MEEELKKKRQMRNGILKLVFGILGGFVLLCGIVVGIMYLTGAFNPIVTPPESLYFEQEAYEGNGEDDLYLTVLATPDDVTEKEITISVDNNTIFGLKGMTSGNEGNSIVAEIGERILVVPKKNPQGILIGGKTQVVAKTPDQKFTAKASVFIDVPVQSITINTTGASDDNKLYVGGSLDFSSLSYYPTHSKNPLNDFNKIADKSYIITLMSAREQDGEEIWDTVGSYWMFDGKTRTWSFSTEDIVTGSFVANWDTTVNYPKVKTLKVGKFKLTAHAFKTYQEEASVGAGKIFDFMSIKTEKVFEVTQIGMQSIETTNYSNARLGLRYIKASENKKQKLFINSSYALAADSFDLGLKINPIKGFENVDLSERLKDCYITSSNFESINILGAQTIYKNGVKYLTPYTDGLDYYWLIETLKTTSNTALTVGIVDINTNEELTCSVSAYSEEVDTDIFDWVPSQIDMFIEDGVAAELDLFENLDDYIINQNADSSKTPSHDYISFYAVESDDGLLESRLEVDMSKELILESGVKGYLIPNGYLTAKGFGDVTIYAVLSKTDYNGNVETIGGSIIYRKTSVKLIINTVISNAELSVVDYVESGMDYNNTVYDLYENKQYAVVIKPLTAEGNTEDVEVLKQAIENNKITIEVTTDVAPKVYIRPDTKFEYDVANEIYYVRLIIDDLSKEIINKNAKLQYKLVIKYNNAIINEGNSSEIYTLIKTSITAVNLTVNNILGKSSQSEAEAMPALVFRAYVSTSGIIYNYYGTETNYMAPTSGNVPLSFFVTVDPNITENENAYILESSDSTVIKIEEKKVDGKTVRVPVVDNISNGYVYLTAYASTNRDIYSTVKIKVEAEKVSFSITNDNSQPLSPEGYVIDKNTGAYGSEVQYHRVYVGSIIDIKQYVKVLYHNNGDVEGTQISGDSTFITYSFTRAGEEVYEKFASEDFEEGDRDSKAYHEQRSVIEIIKNPVTEIPLTVNITTRFGQVAKYHLMITPAINVVQELRYSGDSDTNTNTKNIVALYGGKEYQTVFFTARNLEYDISSGMRITFNNALAESKYLQYNQIVYEVAEADGKYAFAKKSTAGGDVASVKPRYFLTKAQSGHEMVYEPRLIAVAICQYMPGDLSNLESNPELKKSRKVLFEFQILIVPDFRVTYTVNSNGDKVYNAGDYDMVVYPAGTDPERKGERIEVMSATTYEMFNVGASEKPSEKTRFVLRRFFEVEEENSDELELISETEHVLEIASGQAGKQIAGVTGADSKGNNHLRVTISDEVFVETEVIVRITLTVPIKYTTEYKFIVEPKYKLDNLATEQDRRIYASPNWVNISTLYRELGVKPNFEFEYEFADGKTSIQYATISDKNIQGLEFSGHRPIQIYVFYKKSNEVRLNTFFVIEVTVEYNLSDDNPVLTEYQDNVTMDDAFEVECYTELDLEEIFEFRERYGGNVLTPTYEIIDHAPGNEVLAYIKPGTVGGNTVQEKYIVFKQNYIEGRIIELRARPLDYKDAVWYSVYFKLKAGQVVEVTYPLGESDLTASSIGQGSDVQVDFTRYEQASAGDVIDLHGNIALRYSSGDLHLENYKEFVSDSGFENVNGNIFNIGKQRVVAENYYTNPATSMYEKERPKTEGAFVVQLTYTIYSSLDGVNWVIASTADITITDKGVITISRNLGLTTWFRVSITSEGGINTYYLINAVVPKEDVQENAGIYEVIYNYENPVMLSGEIHQTEGINARVEDKVIDLIADTGKKISVVDRDNYDYEDTFMFKFIVRHENDSGNATTDSKLIESSLTYSIEDNIYKQTATYRINDKEFTLYLTNDGKLLIPANLTSGTIIEIFVYNRYFVYERPYVMRVGNNIMLTTDYGSMGYSIIDGDSEAVEMTYGVTGKFVVTDLQGNDIQYKLNPKVELTIKTPEGSNNNKNNGNDILQLSNPTVQVIPNPGSANVAKVIPSNNVSDPNGTIVQVSVVASYQEVDSDGVVYTIEDEFVYLFLVRPATSILFYNDIAKTSVNSIINPYDAYQTQTINLADRILTENLSTNITYPKPAEDDELTFTATGYEDFVHVTKDGQVTIIGDVEKEKIIEVKATTWYGYYTSFYINLKPTYIFEVKGGDANQVYDLYSYQRYNPLKELTDCEDGTRYIAISKYDLDANEYVQMTFEEILASGFIDFEIEYLYKNDAGTLVEAETAKSANGFMSYYFNLVEDDTITSVSGNAEIHEDYRIGYYVVDGKKIYYNGEFDKYYQIVDDIDTFDITIDYVTKDKEVTAVARLKINQSRYVEIPGDGEEPGGWQVVVVQDGAVYTTETRYLIQVQQNFKDIEIFNNAENGVVNEQNDPLKFADDAKYTIAPYIFVNLLRDYNISTFYSKKQLIDEYKVVITDENLINLVKDIEPDGSKDGDDFYNVTADIGDGEEPVTIYYNTAGDYYYIIYTNYLADNRTEIYNNLKFIASQETTASIREIYNPVSNQYEMYLDIPYEPRQQEDKFSFTIEAKESSIITNTALYISINSNFNHAIASNFSQAYSGETIDLNILGDSFIANNGQSLVDGTLSYYLVDDKDAALTTDYTKYAEISNGILTTESVSQKTERMILIVFEKEVNGTPMRYLGVTTITILPRYTIQPIYSNGLNYALIKESDKDFINSISRWQDYVTFYRNGEKIDFSTLENSNEIANILVEGSEKIEHANGITVKIKLKVKEKVDPTVEYFVQTSYEFIYSPNPNLTYNYAERSFDSVENFYNGDKVTLEDQVGYFYINNTKLEGTYDFELLNSSQSSNITLNKDVIGKSVLESVCSLSETTIPVLVKFTSIYNGEQVELFTIMHIKFNASVSFGLSYENVEQKVTIIQVGEAINLADTMQISYNNYLADKGTFSYQHQFNVYDDNGFYFSATAASNTAEEINRVLTGVKGIRNQEGEIVSMENIPANDAFFNTLFDYDIANRIFTPKLNLQMCSIVIKTVVSYTYEGETTSSNPIYFHLSVQGVEYTFTPSATQVQLTYSANPRYFTKYDLGLFGKFSIQDGLSQYEVSYESSDSMFSFANTLVWYNLSATTEESKVNTTLDKAGFVEGDTTTDASGVSYILTRAYYISQIITIEDIASQVLITFETGNNKFYALVDVMVISPIEIYANSPIVQHGTEDVKEKISITNENGDPQDVTSMLINLINYLTLSNVGLIGFENINVGIQLSIANKAGDVLANLATSYLKPTKVDVDVNDNEEEIDTSAYAFFTQAQPEEGPAIEEECLESYFIKMYFDESTNKMVCYFAPYKNIDFVLDKMKNGYTLDVAFTFNVLSTRQTAVVTYRIEFTDGFTDANASFRYDVNSAKARENGLNELITSDLNGYTIISNATIEAEKLADIVIATISDIDKHYEDYVNMKIVFTSGANCVVSESGDRFTTNNVLKEEEGIVYFNFNLEEDSSTISSSFAFKIAPIFESNLDTNVFANQNLNEVTLEVDEGRTLDLYTAKLGEGAISLIKNSSNVELGITNVDVRNPSQLRLNISANLYDSEENLIVQELHGNYFTITGDSVENYKVTMKPGTEGMILVLYLSFYYPLDASVEPVYYTLILKSKKCSDYIDSEISKEISQISDVVGSDYFSVSSVDLTDYSGTFRIGDTKITEANYSGLAHEYSLVSNPNSTFSISGSTLNIDSDKIVRPYDIPVVIQDYIEINGVGYYGYIELVFKTEFDVTTETTSAYVNQIFDLKNYFKNKSETSSKTIREVYVDGVLKVLSGKPNTNVTFKDVLTRHQIHVVFGDYTAYCLDVFVRYDNISISYSFKHDSEATMLRIREDVVASSIVAVYYKDGSNAGTGAAPANAFRLDDAFVFTGTSESTGYTDSATLTYTIDTPSASALYSIVTQTVYTWQWTGEYEEDSFGNLEEDDEGNPIPIYEYRPNGEYKTYLAAKQRSLYSKYDVLTVTVTFLGVDYKINIPIEIASTVQAPTYTGTNADPIVVELNEGEKYSVKLDGLTITKSSNALGIQLDKTNGTVHFVNSTGKFDVTIEYQFINNEKFTVQYTFIVHRVNTNYEQADLEVSFDLDDHRSVGFTLTNGNAVNKAIAIQFKTSASLSGNQLSNFYSTTSNLGGSTSTNLKYGSAYIVWDGNPVQLISSKSGLYEITEISGKNPIITFYVNHKDITDFVYIMLTSNIGDHYYIKVNFKVTAFTPLFGNVVVDADHASFGINLISNTANSSKFNFVSFQITYFYLERSGARSLESNAAFSVHTSGDYSIRFNRTTDGESADWKAVIDLKISDGSYRFDVDAADNDSDIIVNADSINMDYTLKVKLKADSNGETIQYNCKMTHGSNSYTGSPQSTPSDKTCAYTKTQHVRIGYAESLVVFNNGSSDMDAISAKFSELTSVAGSVLIDKASETIKNVVPSYQDTNYMVHFKHDGVSCYLEVTNFEKRADNIGKVDGDFELRVNGSALNEIVIKSSSLKGKNALNANMYDLTKVEAYAGGTKLEGVTYSITKAESNTAAALLKVASTNIVPTDKDSLEFLKGLIYDYHYYLNARYVDSNGVVSCVWIPILIEANKIPARLFVNGVAGSSFTNDTELISEAQKAFNPNNSTALTINFGAGSQNGPIKRKVSTGTLTLTHGSLSQYTQTMSIQVYYCLENTQEFSVTYEGADEIILYSHPKEGQRTTIDLTKFNVKVNNTTVAVSVVDKKFISADDVFNKMFVLNGNIYTVQPVLNDYNGYIYVKFKQGDAYYYTTMPVRVVGDRDIIGLFEDVVVDYEFKYADLIANSNYEEIIGEEGSGELRINEINITKTLFELSQSYPTASGTYTRDKLLENYDITAYKLSEGEIDGEIKQISASNPLSYTITLNDIGKTLDFEVVFTDKVFKNSIVIHVTLNVSIQNLLLIQSVNEITPTGGKTQDLGSIVGLIAETNSSGDKLIDDLQMLIKAVERVNETRRKENEGTMSEEELNAYMLNLFSEEVLNDYYIHGEEISNAAKEIQSDWAWKNTTGVYSLLVPKLEYFTSSTYSEESQITSLKPEPSLSNTIQRVFVRFKLMKNDGYDTVIHTFHSYFDITLKSVIGNASGSYTMKPDSTLSLFDSAYNEYIEYVELTSAVDTSADAVKKEYEEGELFSISETKELYLAENDASTSLIGSIFKVDIMIRDVNGNSLPLVFYITIAENIEVYTFVKQKVPMEITSGDNVSFYNFDIGTLIYNGLNCIASATTSNPTGSFVFETESEYLSILENRVIARNVLYDTSAIVKATYTDKMDDSVYSFYFNVIIKCPYEFVLNNLVVLSNGETGTYRLVDDGAVIDLTSIITVKNKGVEDKSLSVTYSCLDLDDSCFDLVNNKLTLPTGKTGNFIRIDCMYTNGMQYKSVSYIIKVADLTYSFELKDDTSVYIVRSGQTINLETVKGIFRFTDGLLIEGDYTFEVYMHNEVVNGVEKQIAYYTIDHDARSLIVHPVYENVKTFVIVKLKNEYKDENDETITRNFSGMFELNILATYEIDTCETLVSVDGGVNARVDEEAASQDLKVNYFDFGHNFALVDTYRDISYSEEEIVALKDNADADIVRTFTYLFDGEDITQSVNNNANKAYIVDGIQYFSIENNIVTFTAYASNHTLTVIATYKSLLTDLEISSSIDIRVVQNRFISLMKEDLDTAKLLNGDFDVIKEYSYEFININKTLTYERATVAAGAPAEFVFSLDGIEMFTLSEGALKFTEDASFYKLRVVGGGKTTYIMCGDFVERENGYILSVDADSDHANENIAGYSYTFVSSFPTVSAVNGTTTVYSCGDEEMFTIKNDAITFKPNCDGLTLLITSSYTFEGTEKTYISSQEVDCSKHLDNTVVLTRNNETERYNDQLKYSFDLRYVIRLVDKEGYMIDINRDDFTIYINGTKVESSSFLVAITDGSYGRKTIKIVDNYTGEYVEYYPWLS